MGSYSGVNGTLKWARRVRFVVYRRHAYANNNFVNYSRIALLFFGKKFYIVVYTSTEATSINFDRFCNEVCKWNASRLQFQFNDCDDATIHNRLSFSYSFALVFTVFLTILQLAHGGIQYIHLNYSALHLHTLNIVYAFMDAVFVLHIFEMFLPDSFVLNTRKKANKIFYKFNFHRFVKRKRERENEILERVKKRRFTESQHILVLTKTLMCVPKCKETLHKCVYGSNGHYTLTTEAIVLNLGTHFRHYYAML